MPNSIDIIFTPLITILIVAILSLFIVMPVAGLLSDGITSGINAILDFGGVVAGALLAGFFPTTRYGWVTSRSHTYTC